MTLLLSNRLTVLITVTICFINLSFVSGDSDSEYPSPCQCACACPDGTPNCLCDCACETPATVCGPGFSKVCPQKKGRCRGETPVSVCPLEIETAMKRLRKEHKIKGRRVAEPVRETRARTRVTQEVKCDGIPKFECTFIFDYRIYKKVTSFRASMCTHRKKIKNCPVTIPADYGCEVTVNLFSKNKEVKAKGRKKLNCPPNPQNTNLTTGAPIPTVDPIISLINQSDNFVGDGCSCVPDVALLMASSVIDPVETRMEEKEFFEEEEDSEEEEYFEEEEDAEDRWFQDFDDRNIQTRGRDRITKEVFCGAGVPKFTCDFILDYDKKYCETVSNIRAGQCNHRKIVRRCPVEIKTSEGCTLEFTITNRGGQMLVSPKKEISGGPERQGFMSKCVCLAPWSQSSIY